MLRCTDKLAASWLRYKTKADDPRGGGEMSELVERLRGFRFLDGLEQAELERLAAIATVDSYPVGSLLTEEGAAADRLYLLLSGVVTVRVRLPDGDCGVLDEIAAGEVLGWSAVLPPYCYTASACVTQEVKAVVLPAPALRELCEAHHHLGYCLLRNAGEVVARRYGRAIGSWPDLREKDLRALHGLERVVWEDGDTRLTTEALILEAGADSPEVIPLESILSVESDGDCLVVHAVGGDTRSGKLQDAGKVVCLVTDELRRVRLPHRRVGGEGGT